MIPTHTTNNIQHGHYTAHIVLFVDVNVLENSDISQFEGQKYLNLETFRKSGVGVKTPVWFVEQDGVRYVRTISDSGKVKRIRNNGRVRIVPCKSQGEPLGEWVEAQAELVNSAEAE